MPRPEIKPTEEQRRLVKSLAAFGVPQEKIAREVGTFRSPKTLRKYFRKELDSGAVEANANVAKTGYELATDGKHQAMTMFWLERHCGWYGRPNVEVKSTALRPFIVAKDDGVRKP